MNTDSNQTRRAFLGNSAKAVAIAGISSVAGCAAGGTGRKLDIVAGPRPRRIDPDNPIRLGLIGVGGRNRDLLNATAELKANVQIKAIADPSEQNVNARLAFIQEKWNQTPEIYRGADDYKSKLLARDDIDVVIVATPPDLHAEMYLACFAAGKHFYGEKPMCIEVDEVNALVKAQEKNPDVLCMIGFQRRASSYYQAAVKRIHEGMIGPVFEALGAWRISSGPLGMPGSGTQIWFGRRKHSGDWMLEQACHTWDVFCWVTGEMPVAVSGRGRRWLFKEQDPDRDVTDFYVAHLEYPSGVIADFEHNWMCPQHDEQRKFTGIFERFTGPKGGISLGVMPVDATYYPRDGREKPVKLAEKTPNDTLESVASFYQSLRTNTTPVSGVANGRMATLTGLLVRKAVYENRRVEMKELIGA